MPAKIGAKGPRKGTKRATTIAAGLSQGKTQAQIAREVGVSRQAIHKQLPQAQQLIANLIDGRRAEVEAIFLQALNVIQDGLTADRMALARVVTTTELAGGKKKRTESAEVVDLGADHFARLTAVKRFIEITTAGRPTPKAPEDSSNQKGPVTWNQLQELVRQQKQTTQPLSPSRDGTST